MSMELLPNMIRFESASRHKFTASVSSIYSIGLSDAHSNLPEIFSKCFCFVFVRRSFAASENRVYSFFVCINNK